MRRRAWWFDLLLIVAAFCVGGWRYAVAMIVILFVIDLLLTLLP